MITEAGLNATAPRQRGSTPGKAAVPCLSALQRHLHTVPVDDGLIELNSKARSLDR